MDLAILKGTRDYGPCEQMIRNQVISTLQHYFGLYGYQPLETPILNYFEILASKYAGGSEILKETYHLQDQGGRNLGMRYDLTVPFARYIGMNAAMPLPFKRYEIGKVFRNGPIKAGRMREFTQCDVDVCGSKSMSYDAELLVMAFQVFNQLGIQVRIEINNRKLLSGLIQMLNIPETQVSGVILSIDKLHKIGRDGVISEMNEKGIDGEPIGILLDLLAVSEGAEVESVLDRYREYQDRNEWIRNGLVELEELNRYLQAADMPKATVMLNPSLARGLEIYTGTVFEVFAVSGGITSSLAAGGRYDRIIGAFLNSSSDDAYPAVGICFGLDVIYAVLAEMNRETSAGSGIQVLIIPIQTPAESFKLLIRLRQAGIPSDMAPGDQKIKKSLSYANKTGIPFCLIIGEDEIARQVYTLRDMKQGQEHKQSWQELVSFLRP